MSLPYKRSKSHTLIISINALLILCIGAIFFVYNANYRKKLFEQNIIDMRNINQSSANIGGIFFQTEQKKLYDIAQYVSLRAFDYQRTLDYIYESQKNADSHFELIDTARKGTAVVRSGAGYVPVDYSHNDYRFFSSVCTGNSDTCNFAVYCTPEFTDSYTACKSFALYTHLHLTNPDHTITPYTLLAVSQSRSFSSLIELNGGYPGMATVFIDKDGNYIIGSSEFKANNLFQYFYEYNNLSLDEKTKCIKQFSDAPNGEFFFQNSRKDDCVYAYTSVPTTDWYCVSCVPVASFRMNNSHIPFIIWITVLLLALMFFNILWLNFLNRKLKTSVQNEKKAGEAKTEFLSRMSHDIRTPLNVIIGMTQLAQKEDNPPKTQRYLNNVNQSSNFLLSLVNDILDLNKVESGKMELHPEPYSFEQFSSNIKAIIVPLCTQKNLEFKIDSDEYSHFYLLDPVRINQIFFNILSNSVKFTASGGHLSLSCKETPNGKTVLLTFIATDDGIGMSQEFQKHMFEAFTQETNNTTLTYQGTGLGLTIVKRLVDLMNGTLRVQSELGKGTSFYITIPTQLTAPVLEKGTPVSSSVSLAGKHILLFEDNELNAEIATALLTDQGMLVTTVQNGKIGVETFAQSAEGQYDIVLMDLRMPVMNGFEATKKIRTLERNDAKTIPIIAMTANAYDIDIQNCLEAGMNAHLSKPINQNELITVLTKYANTQT